jgi:iron-sulfur cluster assembly protein
MNINVSDRAVEQLKKHDIGPKKFLRIAVVSGGCSGMTYNAVIDTELDESDEILFEKDGVRIVSEFKSMLYLDGLHIDYSDDLINAGFRFTNPNAQKSCGCGASFAA